MCILLRQFVARPICNPRIPPVSKLSAFVETLTTYAKCARSRSKPSTCSADWCCCCSHDSSAGSTLCALGRAGYCLECPRTP
eukprot:1315091-Amorphochlora_amoeboformis.AAC.3